MRIKPKFDAYSHKNMNPTLNYKLKRLAVCGVLIFIINMVSSYIMPVMHISNLGPASALPPVFGLLFGPWGALGSALGYLASDIVSGDPPSIYLVYFFVQFLYSYIPYKLWYILDHKSTIKTPRLDTVRNLTKFVVIMFINATVMAGFQGFLLDGLGIYNLVSLITVIFALNNFDFSIMFGTLVLIGASYHRISITKPPTREKTRLPSQFYNTLGVVALATGVGNVIYSLYSGPDLYSTVAGAVTYTLALIYFMKPVTKQVVEKEYHVRVTLTEKLILVSIIMGAIIAMVTGILSSYTIPLLPGEDMVFWEAVYLHVTVILSIFYISSILLLSYIERTITIPLESMSKIVANYVSDSEGITSNALIIAKCQEYAADQTEVGILANSFQNMIQDLEVYLENLKRVTSEKEKINAELDVARKIQANMLPQINSLGDRDEFSIYATNLPALEVGGDFYDFFMVDDTHLAVVIGDVSGKGVPAALFMVIAKTLIKNQAQLGKKPEEVFATANNLLVEGNDENMFVTSWMGILETTTGRFTYVNAGHNPPLLLHRAESLKKEGDGQDRFKSGEKYQWLKSKPGFILGGMEDIRYHQECIQLEPGDVIYMYTDGVTEAINQDGEMFGEERLVEALTSPIENIKGQKEDCTNTCGAMGIKSNPKSGFDDMCTEIQSRINEFSGDQEQFDDITILCLEYKGSNKKSDTQ
ncbi:PP2C family protein-serine/threonine phosphatase [Methanobacterium sp.]|uniref:PP2C family protein-serine/threonine phosphatase n=1 Tax=Methanobacterium sp. TaxID=2164 RepID=UPI00262367E2|nr:PP2C family protein-serine/threonine phosphatase [Methanobacterium sp.]